MLLLRRAGKAVTRDARALVATRDLRQAREEALARAECRAFGHYKPREHWLKVVTLLDYEIASREPVSATWFRRSCVASLVLLVFCLAGSSAAAAALT